MVRSLIRDVRRALRPWAQRAPFALVAAVFVAMGGARGMDAHPLSSHGSPAAPHSGHMIAAEAQASHDAGVHAGHHRSGPAEEGTATECTCVGPCQGGTATASTRTASHDIAVGDVGCVRLVSQTARLIDRDPTSHLLPLPNPPPARA